MLFLIFGSVGTADDIWVHDEVFLICGNIETADSTYRHGMLNFTDFIIFSFSFNISSINNNLIVWLNKMDIYATFY